MRQFGISSGPQTMNLQLNMKLESLQTTAEIHCEGLRNDYHEIKSSLSLSKQIHSPFQGRVRSGVSPFKFQYHTQYCNV
jgi:hypothetical protein